MNPKALFVSRWRLASLLVAAGFGLHAQTAPPPVRPAAPAPAAKPAPDETVQLSAFEVRADADNSYGALESNSLTAFRMDLEKMPATVEVFTRTFMDDIAATSIEEVLVGYAGTVSPGTGNAAAMINSSTTDRDGGSAAVSIRGDAPSRMKRDGFTGPNPGARTTTGITDNFSVERAEVIAGPQSILYGSVGGGGVINAVSKRAQFGRQNGSVQARFNQYGSKRGTLDYNIGLKNVAVRVAATAAENRGPRYNLGGDFTGFYTQIAFRVAQNTIVRVQTEKTDNWAIYAFKPNLDNFLPTGDVRRGKDARFLALTGQLENLGNAVINGGVNYWNLESLAAWWNSEHIKDHYSSMTVEQKLPGGLSAQLQAYYDDMVDNRITGVPSLVPGKGKTGAGNNPYDGTAIRLAPPLTDNQQRNRDKGVRAVLLHEKDFSFWKFRGHSNTGLTASGFHSYPGFGSGGLSYQYYQADANWNPVIGTATTNYGRIPLATELFVPVQNGIPLKPILQPSAPRLTINGVNYVRLQQLQTNPANETPGNFKGVVPNSGATGFTGSFNNNSETHSRYFSAVNVTDWWDGKLTTMAGYGFTNFESLNLSLTPPNTFVKFKYLAGWGTGVSYRVLPWLHAFALYSKAAQASGSTDDIIGVPLKTPDAKQGLPEMGLKARLLDNRLQVQFSWNPETLTRFANQNIGDASFTDIINPNGINTRFGTGTRTQQRVNLDRTLGSQELALTANPTPNWRLRFSATHMDGKIAKDVTYSQLYNDQFYANSAGVVTYKDGTPLLVDPAGGNGAKTAQLTIAMMNNAASPYAARPNADSGVITNTTLRNVLTAVDPVRGTAATGVAGLPISAVQYQFTSPYPNGQVTIYREGEKNTGFNEYNFSFQNNYTFREGMLRGLGVFLDLGTYLKNRAYYTIYPGAGGATTAAKQVRTLYSLPRYTSLNYGLSYRYKLWGRYSVTTQLNVRNALNHYAVWVLPTAGNGNTLNARLSAQPRELVWTNTLTF